MGLHLHVGRHSRLELGSSNQCCVCALTKLGSTAVKAWSRGVPKATGAAVAQLAAISAINTSQPNLNAAVLLGAGNGSNCIYEIQAETQLIDCYCGWYGF